MNGLLGTLGSTRREGRPTRERDSTDMDMIITELRGERGAKRRLVFWYPLRLSVVHLVLKIPLFVRSDPAFV